MSKSKKKETNTSDRYTIVTVTKTREEYAREQRELREGLLEDYESETRCEIEAAIIAVLDKRHPDWRGKAGWGFTSHSEDLLLDISVHG